MDEKVVVVAVNCKRLSGIYEIAERHGSVVFGTMGGHSLAGLNNSMVYFYETG